MVNLDDYGNDALALRDALAAVPASGGELGFPAGVSDFGAAAIDAILTVRRDNVTFRGAGIGQTIVRYSSARPASGLGPGSCFLLGCDGQRYRGLTFLDMTIEDTNPNTTVGGGHWPSAIDADLIEHLRVERVEFRNIKGNGAMTALVNTNDEGLIVRDCRFDGDAAGGWIEGDGLNVGYYSNAVIEGNLFRGVLRHGIEGGGLSSFHIDRNRFDMLNQGYCPIGGACFAHGTFDANEAIDIANDPSRAMIQVSQDNPETPYGDFSITNNKLWYRNNSSPLAKLLYWQPLDSAACVGPVIVANNQAKCSSLVHIDTVCRHIVTGNIVDMGAHAGPLVNSSGDGPVLGPHDFLDVHHNRLANVQVGTPGARVLPPLGQVTNWRSPRVRASDNIIGSTFNDARTSQADGGWAVDTCEVPQIAPGAASPERFVDYAGALGTDQVDAVTPSGLPSGALVLARVAAPDLIGWRVANLSDVLIDPLQQNYWLRINRR